MARRLVGARRGRLELELDHELPIGQGFGMSAAGALATGLVVAEVLGEPSQRAIEVAHLADLFGGGGLGGVSAILGGGLEVRRRAGVPPWGRIGHYPWRPPIYVAIVGPPVPSPRLLRDPAFLRRVRTAARGELRTLAARPREHVLLAAARRFEERLGWAPSPVVEALRALRAEGFSAGQTLFGQAVYAVPPKLREGHRVEAAFRALGLEVRKLRPARRGAHPLRTHAIGRSRRELR